MSKALETGTVGSREQAYTLAPVLRRTPSPIYPLAWVCRITKEENRTRTALSSNYLQPFWRNVLRYIRVLGRIHTPDTLWGDTYPSQLTSDNFTTREVISFRSQINSFSEERTRQVRRSLRWSYFRIRYQNPISAIVIAMFFVVVAFVALAYSDTQSKEKNDALRRDNMLSLAIGSNVLNDFTNPLTQQSIRQQAVETLAAGAIWQSAREQLKDIDSWGDYQQIISEMHLTELTLDKLARRLLGLTYSVSVYDPQHFSESFSHNCELVKPSDSDNQNTELKAKKLQGRAVAFDLHGFRLSAQGQPVQARPGILPTQLAAGSQYCLSDDGEILTVSPPSNPWPLVYEISWYKRASTDLTESLANPTEITAPSLFRERKESKSNRQNVLSRPNVDGISSRDSRTGARFVKFNLANTDGEYVATFYEGLAVPIILKQDTTNIKIAGLKDCNPNPDLTSCQADLEIEGVGKLRFVNIENRPPDGPAYDAVQVFFEEGGPTPGVLGRISRYVRSYLFRRVGDPRPAPPLARLYLSHYAPAVKKVALKPRRRCARLVHFGWSRRNMETMALYR